MENKKIDLSNRLYIPLLLVGAALLVLFVVSAYAAYNSANGYYPREITVSGQGRAFIKPDIAVVSLGVYNEGKDAKQVISNNNDKMKKITAAVKEIGIEDKDIRTSNYNFSLKYNWSESKGSFVDGYTINQEIEVKIRNFDNINKVLEKAGEKGADNISQLQFTVDDPQKAKEEAMVEAVNKAKEKAQSIAKASGLKLGRLLNVYEDTYASPTPSYGMAENAAGKGGGSDIVAPDIQPGQQEVSVTMSLTYRLK